VTEVQKVQCAASQYVGIAAGMHVMTCLNDTGHSTGAPAHHRSIHTVNPPRPLQFIQTTHACTHSFTRLWSIQTLQRYFSQRRKHGRPHKHASATHTKYACTLSTGHLLHLQWPPTSSPKPAVPILHGNAYPSVLVRWGRPRVAYY